MYFLLHPIFGKSLLLLQELVRKRNVRLLLQKYSTDFRTNRIRHKRPRPKIGRPHFRTGELVRKSVRILLFEGWGSDLL